MAVPYFVADSAQVTVLRSLASTAFGKYGLKLPEGVDIEDVYEVAAPGNELAYVSSLGSKRRVGGMFRRFVRADVSVTAEGEGMVPASDVERVLDEASKRVSGDFFLESDISKAGLGPWVPFVDFHVGDIANVEIWGRVVPLAVTRIEPKRTEHSDNDWSVHVGGQLLSDSEARLAENEDIYNAVVSDRRDLAGVEAKASQAAKAASVAQSTADSARGEVQAVRDTLAGEQAGEPDLVSQLVAVNDELQRLGQEPQPSLMLAFVQLSTALWEAQQEIDAVQTTAIAENEARIGEIETLTDELVKTQQELVARRIPVLSNGNDGQYFSRNGTTITARGEWAGDVQVLEDKVGPRAVRIPNPEGGRTISLTNAGSWVTLLVLVSQGVMRRFIGDLSTSWPSASVSWGVVPGSPSFTASMTGVHTIRAKVAWQRAVYSATYGLRIVVDGSVVKTIEQSKVGPWIGHGLRTQILTATDVMVNAGQKVELQVKADTGEGLANQVRSLTLDVVWVEGA